MKKLCVNIEEYKDYFKIEYLVAKSEEEYNEGNHDVINFYTIDKDIVENEEDLIEQIKLYDAYYENAEVEIIEKQKRF